MYCMYCLISSSPSTSDVGYSKSYDSDSESQLNKGDETWINTRGTLNPFFFGGGLTETAASNYRDERGTFTGFAVSEGVRI